MRSKVLCVSISLLFVFFNQARAEQMKMGITWSPIGPGITKLYHLEHVPGTGGYFAAYGPGGIYLSADFGKSFAPYPIPTEITGIQKLFLGQNQSMGLITNDNKIYYVKRQVSLDWKKFYLMGDINKNAGLKFIRNHPTTFENNNYSLYISPSKNGADGILFHDFDAHNYLLINSLNQCENPFVNKNILYKNNKVYAFCDDGKTLYYSDFGGLRWNQYTFPDVVSFKEANAFVLSDANQDVYYLLGSKLFLVDPAMNFAVFYVANLLQTPGGELLEGYSQFKLLSATNHNHTFFFTAYKMVDDGEVYALFQLDTDKPQLSLVMKSSFFFKVDTLPNEKLFISNTEGQFIFDRKSQQINKMTGGVNLSTERSLAILDHGKTLASLTQYPYSSSSFDGKNAEVHFSFDGGKTWEEKVLPPYAPQVAAKIISFKNQLLSWRLKFTSKKSPRNSKTILTRYNFQTKTWEDAFIYKEDLARFIFRMKIMNGSLFVEESRGRISEFKDFPLTKAKHIGGNAFLDQFYFDGKDYYKFSFDSKLYCYVLSKSTDGGKSFQIINNHFDYRIHFAKLFGFSNQVLILADEETKQILKSTDGGLHFNPIWNSELNKDIELNDIFLFDKKTYLIATGQGLFLTKDGGLSYSPQNGNLINKEIKKIFYSDDGALFISTKGSGIYRGDLSSCSTSCINRYNTSKASLGLK